MWEIRNIFLSLHICILFCSNAFSQNTFDDIINQELYASERTIVNGISWTNSVRYQGNRFFGSKEWKIGQLSFDGKEYTDLLINYDLLEDEIILYDAVKGNEKYIKLNKDKIDSFRYVVNGVSKRFKKIEIKNTSQKELCELIYEGKISYYIKHKKSVQKQIGTTYMGRLYEDNTHYLKNENGIHSFKNKKKVLHALGNSKELKKYIRQNNLLISPKHPQDIVQLIRFNETLDTNNSTL